MSLSLAVAVYLTDTKGSMREMGFVKDGGAIDKRAAMSLLNGDTATLD